MWSPMWEVFDFNEEKVFEIRGPRFISKDENFFKIYSSSIRISENNNSDSDEKRVVGRYFFHSQEERMLDGVIGENGISCNKKSNH